MHIWIVWVGILFSQTGYGFDYFGNRIDYWQPHVEAPKSEPSETKSPPASQFDWKKFKDPANEEFFKEGDYTPPKPFMELARNPTDENIRNWMNMMETKNKLMQRLHSSMADYIKRNGHQLKSEAKAELINQVNNLPMIAQDIHRFRFRLYFDSSCPHCERMMKTAKTLQDLGYYIEARQVDRKKPTFAVPMASSFATPQEIRAKKITAWPVLFVGDTVKNLVYRIQGYQDTQSILGVLKSK